MFETITLEDHKGKSSTIPAGRIMELLAVLQSKKSDPNRLAITDPDSLADIEPPRAAVIYSRMLDFNGVKASANDIGARMFQEPEYMAKVYEGILAPIQMLQPPEDFKGGGKKKATKGKTAKG